jgi:Putative collagen-binding domain of a collagenase/Protein of unknown function (DUF4038)
MRRLRGSPMVPMAWSWHTAIGQPPTDHANTGIAKTWREAVSLPGSTQMKYLGQFFTSIPWWKLEPDPRLVPQQPTVNDTSNHVSASRSETGDLAVVYFPRGGRVKLGQGKLGEGIRGEWFNPRTGQSTPIEGSVQGAKSAHRTSRIGYSYFVRTRRLLADNKSTGQRRQLHIMGLSVTTTGRALDVSAETS